MMSNYLFNFLAWTFLHLIQIFNCKCINSKLVNLTRAGVFCSASSSMPGMPCQGAWDADSGTIWHPGTSGEQAYTAIYMQDFLIIKKIVVDQYSWISGYATKLQVEVEGDLHLLEAVPGSVPPHLTHEWSPDTDNEYLTTKIIVLHITEVGPRQGSAFGGIQGIRIFGCFASDIEAEKMKQSRSYEGKKTKTSKMTVEDDVFMFDSSSKPSDNHPQVKVAAKQSGDHLALPLLIGGVLLLTLGLCVWMVVYGIRAKKRYFVNEDPTVMITRTSHVRESQDRLNMEEDEEDDINTIPYP